MGKYLLLLAGVLVLYWIIRAGIRRRAERAARDAAAGRNKIADDMVRCADCGVHLPRGESLTVKGQFYCSAEHQRRHHRDD